MTTPTNHWKLGLFVVAGSVLALATTGYLASRSLRKETVDYTSYFDESVTGLEVGSPVKFRGVTIGNVSSIDIAPDRRHVAITYQLGVSVLDRLGLATGLGQETTLPAPPDLRAQLGSSGITGVKYVSLDFFDIRSNPALKLPFPVAGNYIPSASSTMKNLEDSVVRAVDAFPRLAADLTTMLQHINIILGDVESQQLPAKVNGVLANADRMIGELRNELGQLKTAELSKDAQAAIARLNTVLTSLDDTIARVNGDRGVLTSMQRASDSVGDVAANARGYGPELGATMRDLRDAAEAIRQLADALELDSDMLLKGRAKGDAR